MSEASGRMVLAEHDVVSAEVGDVPSFEGGRLTVSAAELEMVATREAGVAGLDVAVCAPGEPVRINGVVDVLEPRAKAPGSPGDTFPGLAGGATTCGTGRTVALAGAAVVIVAELSDRGETFVQEDCLIDMGEPTARYSPFSATVNVVVRVRFRRDLDEVLEFDAARNAGVRIARHLAGMAVGTEPDRVVDVAGPSAVDGQARVAYVCSLISEGPLHDTLLYGRSTESLTPRWIDLEEMLDGALVSSDVHYSNQRTPTYLYQRNPIVGALSEREDVSLSGILLTLRYGSHAEKRKAAEDVVSLAREAGVDGLITHPAVGGNAHVDAIDIVAVAEEAGIRTALVLQEMAGPTGGDFGLVHVQPEADALVSTGNRDEVIVLPPVERVIGPPALRNGDPAAAGSSVSLRSYLCSTGQVGAHRLTATLG